MEKLATAVYTLGWGAETQRLCFQIQYVRSVLNGFLYA